jgi:hypothetical protein
VQLDVIAAGSLQSRKRGSAEHQICMSHTLIFFNPVPEGSREGRPVGRFPAAKAVARAGGMVVTLPVPRRRGAGAVPALGARAPLGATEPAAAGLRR